MQVATPFVYRLCFRNQEHDAVCQCYCKCFVNRVSVVTSLTVSELLSLTNMLYRPRSEKGLRPYVSFLI